MLNQIDRYYCIHQKTCEWLKIDPMSREVYWLQKRNKVSECDILTQCGAAKKNLNIYINRRVELLEQSEYLSLDEVHPGVYRALSNLMPHYNLVIVTLRHNKETLHRQLSVLKLDRYFRAVLNGGGATTPAYHEKVKMITDWLGKDLSNGWLFGDTETDILTGSSLGFRTVVTEFGIRSMDVLEPYSPNFTICSWEMETWPSNLLHSLKIASKDFQ